MKSITHTLFPSSLLLLLLPSLLWATTANALPQDDAKDAQALKVAEAKLALLAKEGNNPTPPEAAAQPAPEKKKGHPARKKKHPKARAKARAASAAPPRVVKVTNRRLTVGEVQGILATTRDFAGADLSGMSLVGMDFSGVRFNRANLQQANLERADLAETDLELANLAGANLRGASLNQARLRGTSLDGAKLEGALWTDKTVCKKGSVGTCIE